jgi:hypothetical protein
VHALAAEDLTHFAKGRAVGSLEAAQHDCAGGILSGTLAHGTSTAIRTYGVRHPLPFVLCVLPTGNSSLESHPHLLGHRVCPQARRRLIALKAHTRGYVFVRAAGARRQDCPKDSGHYGVRGSREELPEPRCAEGVPVWIRISSSLGGDRWFL